LVPRQVYIRKNVELEKYGYTDFCRGCVAAALDQKAKPHTPECRARILEEMRKAGDTERIEEADRKRARVHDPRPATPASEKQDEEMNRPDDTAV
jgi:hypothetical protein